MRRFFDASTIGLWVPAKTSTLLLSFLLTLVFSFDTNVNASSAVTPTNQDEAGLYKTWYEANAAKDFPKAYDLAKQYLKSFPTGKNADYLTKWLPVIRRTLLNEAIKAKNMNEAIRLGNEELATDPENIDYLTVLATNISAQELFANPPNFAHAAEAADFSLRVIKLVEAGKKPSVAAEPWNQNQFLAYFHQTLATIEEHNKNTDKALEHYVKASTLEPTNARHFFACGRLRQEKYAKSLEKYLAFPEAERTAAAPGENVKAALDDVNRAADSVIDCWVTFLRLTASASDWAPTREKVEKSVAELYKYRHPDSPDGFRQLIKQ